MGLGPWPSVTNCHRRQVSTRNPTSSKGHVARFHERMINELRRDSGVSRSGPYITEPVPVDFRRVGGSKMMRTLGFDATGSIDAGNFGQHEDHPSARASSRAR